MSSTSPINIFLVGVEQCKCNPLPRMDACPFHQRCEESGPLLITGKGFRSLGPILMIPERCLSTSTRRPRNQGRCRTQVHWSSSIPEVLEDRKRGRSKNISTGNLGILRSRIFRRLLRTKHETASPLPSEEGKLRLKRRAGHEQFPALIARLFYAKIAIMNREEVLKLAKLARIDLENGEAESLSGEFDAILGYVGEVKEVSSSPRKDLGESLGLSSGTVLNVMREDINPHQSGLYTEKILKQAPAREGNYLKVKKIL